MDLVYLDNNATTRVAPEVREAMGPYLSELYGNPSSMHSFGGRVRHAVDEAREQTAALLRARPSEIVFTSGGTESNNTAIRGVLDAQPDKRHIITTAVEHPAVRALTRHLTHDGYELTELPVSGQGELDLEELRSAIRPDTALVTVMYANNETGVIFPITEIGNIVKEKGIPFHCDAVQAVGKLPLDLSRSPVDLMSLSAHKFHGPKGVGALYVRRKTRLVPCLIGGHQERERRAGTENVPGIVGMGAACELAPAGLDAMENRVRPLRDRFEQAIRSTVPDAIINGDRARRLPGTSNVSFAYIEGEAILLLLNEEGICASSGSACTSGALKPSHVLRAMGMRDQEAHGSVRFGLSRYTTADEIDRVIAVLPGLVERLRAISPFGPSRTAR